MAITTISPQELAARQQRGDVCELIDVRTPVEFREVHVTFARNEPLDRLDPNALISVRNGASQPLYLRAAVRRGAWELGLWGDNLLNRDDTSFKQRPVTAIPLVFTTYLRPRTIGLDLKTTF